MRTMPLVALVLLAGASPGEAQADRAEVHRLEQEVARLESAVLERDAVLDDVREQIGAVRDDVLGVPGVPAPARQRQGARPFRCDDGPSVRVEGERARVTSR